MGFRIHLLFICTALCILSLCHANPFKFANWLQIQPKLVGFSWKDCGPASDPAQITNLIVTPDPIHVPGNITINTAFNLTSAGPADLVLTIVMEKKIAGFFVKIPCIDNVGSCTYGDICKDWAEACPKYFAQYGLPCTCPIPPKTYSVPAAVVGVTSKLPSLASGDFHITANLLSPTAGHIVCLQLDVTLAT